MKKFLLLPLLSLFSLNAYPTDPTYDVTKGALQNNSSLCSYGYNPNCNQSNGTSPKKIIRHVTVNVPSKYGALASDRKTSVISGSVNENSLAEAKKTALQRCSDGGKNKNCKIITWVRNGCYAAAAGKDGKIWRLYDAAGELGKAEHQAMSLCESKSSECRITVPETCSTP